MFVLLLSSHLADRNTCLQAGICSDHTECLRKYFSDIGYLRLSDLPIKTTPHIDVEKACGASSLSN
jgi:hypothetical protein